MFSRTASEGHATVGKTRDNPRFLVKFVATRIPGRRFALPWAIPLRPVGAKDHRSLLGCQARRAVALELPSMMRVARVEFLAFQRDFDRSIDLESALDGKPSGIVGD